MSAFPFVCVYRSTANRKYQMHLYFHPVQRAQARVLTASLLLLVGTVAHGLTPVPTADLKGLSDPPGLSRYAGSVLVYRADASYDEVKFPISKTANINDKIAAPKTLDRSGQRVSLQYITPAGKSSLEVLRNYQQATKPAGFETVYECAGEACGRTPDISRYHFSSLLMPETYFTSVGARTPAYCGGGQGIGDVRYAVLDNKSTGSALAIMTWRPGDVSSDCMQAEYRAHAGVFVVSIQGKEREQSMETLSASEMGQSLTATGKVAVYGILFDTNKADIKAESKASLEQIGTLLKQQGSLKLHVVGHTDNVGNLPANLDLSKRRAGAVTGALSKDYGIARDRLTANGVASLAPVASNASDAGKAKNRRVELVLQ